jgi:tRNA (guanine-N7-)-methyltransferase
VPLEVEIGCGKGAFLVAEAPVRPGTRFVGLETWPKRAAYAADRLRRRRIANAEVVRADAVAYIAGLPDSSVGRYWVLFPDPWPKRRHHKRRLFRRPGFVGHLARTLEAGGEVVVVTDHAAYAGEIAAALGAVFDVRRDETTDVPATNFAVKYGREGRVFHRITALGIAPPDRPPPRPSGR